MPVITGQFLDLRMRSGSRSNWIRRVAVGETSDYRHYMVTKLRALLKSLGLTALSY